MWLVIESIPERQIVSVKVVDGKPVNASATIHPLRIFVFMNYLQAYRLEGFYRKYIASRDNRIEHLSSG